MKISEEQFLICQPSYPEETATDPYYHKLAERLLAKALAGPWGRRWPEPILRSAALTLVGYFQDVVSDAGVWRGFISEHRRLYGGRTLPFFEISDEYIDFELNPEDVRFLLWYSVAMSFPEERLLSPLDKDVERLATIWFQCLEDIYEEAPQPEDYRLAYNLDIYEPSDAEHILKLGNWLYLHCWLTTPANLLTLSQITLDLPPGEKGRVELSERIGEAMQQQPTGPLALYMREWLWLTVSDRMPPKPRVKPAEEEPQEHKYYAPFLAATGGERIAFFATYDEMNRFFISALGWAEGEKHLANLESKRDFALLVNPRLGLLVASDVARCINYPTNALYDSQYAADHAIELLTVRGRCPRDLLLFLFDNDALPDACFPSDPATRRLTIANRDFIARCYLQLYYRGD